MKSILTQFILVLLTSLSVFAHGSHCKVSAEDIANVSRVRIFTSPQNISELQENGMDIDHGIWRKDIYFECEVFEKDLPLLALTNTNYEITHQSANEYYNQRRKLYANSKIRSSANGCEDGASLDETYQVPENFELGSFAGFFTYEEALGHLDNMSNLYPELITIKAPISDFKTHENRDIFYMKMSDNPYEDESEQEKQVLYTAVHHAREPVSMSQLIFTMYYLLENYDKDPIIKNMIDNNELFFVPCVNPDGYVIDQETTFINNEGNYFHSFWRKNARDNDENGFINDEDGVDLNRNYSFAWGLNDAGSSPNPSNLTYRGPSAASEPETQAINWLCQQNEFLIALNCHTYSNLLIHPWAYIPFDPTPDSLLFRTIGKALIQDNDYAVGTVDEILGYSVNGDSDDWMYGDETKNKILAFTPEVGSAADGFYPPAERIVPLCLDMVLQNINATRCMNNYAYPTLLNENFNENVGLYNFDILQAGLEAAPISVDITYTNADNSSPFSFDLDLAFSETFNFDVPIAVNENLNSGDKYGVTITVNYSDDLKESFDFFTTFEGVASTEDLLVLIEDSGNNLFSWNTNGWDITTNDFYTEPSCFTDSKNGDYSANQNNSIALSETIDLTNTTKAELKFWAKWNIESNYDYVQVRAIEVSSGTIIPLCGEYTQTGNNYYLPPDEPYYDGFQNEWVEETIDLSNFTGKVINIEFLLYSDGFVEEDGFYFDDFTILTNNDAGVSQPQLGGLGNSVFEDANENGMYDADENGIDDVLVILYDASNTNIPVSTTNTSTNGVYQFTNLDASKEYIVGFETPNGYEPTTYGAGANAGVENDSDLIPETGLTEAFSIEAGGINGTIDAGFKLIETTNTSELKNNFKVFPNPAIDILNLEVNGNYKNPKLVITDVQGKIVLLHNQFSNSKAIIDVSNLTDGLYFYSITDGNKILKTDKLLISK